MIHFFEHIGIAVTHWVRVFTDFSRLCIETFYWAVMGPFKKKPLHIPMVFEHMVFMGIQSIVIVFFVMFFTGIVLAMQSAPQLKQMGGLIYVASLVTISICRELGPVLTALVIAGRIGAWRHGEIYARVDRDCGRLTGAPQPAWGRGEKSDFINNINRLQITPRSGTSHGN